MVAQVNRSIMHPVQIVQGVSNAPYAYRSLVQWFDCINFVRAIEIATMKLIPLQDMHTTRKCLI